MLKDFDKQLMDLLESTNHSEEHSVEKRRERAYKAIFGKQYKADPKIPYYLSEYEMDIILEKIKITRNKEGAIKDVLKERQEPIESDVSKDRKNALESVNAKYLESQIEGITKHLQRHHKDYWELIKEYEKF